MGIFSGWSIVNKKLGSKILIAFSLMSVIPLLIASYFITIYLDSFSENSLYPSLIIFFTVCVAILGFILAKQIIGSFIEVSNRTKEIASGEYDAEIVVENQDEVNDIAEAVNAIRDKMNGYIAELKEYDKKTSILNRKIKRKVSSLTSLVKLGDVISRGSRLSEILYCACEKLSIENENSFSGIFLTEKGERDFVSESFVNRSGKEISIHDIVGTLHLIEKSFREGREHLILDAGPVREEWQTDIRSKLASVNVLFVPIWSNGEVAGIVLTGNFISGYAFNDEDVDIVQAFEKILSIAYQSSSISTKADVLDPLTGLYTRSYMEKRLEDEIRRACFYHRACSLILLSVNDFDYYSRRSGEAKGDQALRQVANFLSGAVPPVAKVVRFGQSEFGIILPETNKREAIDIVESLTEQVGTIQLSDDPRDRVSVSAGIGENPIDGSTGNDIVAKAVSNLEKAVKQNKDGTIG